MILKSLNINRGAQLFRTTMSGEKIYEGILAVHKPEGVTSADVLRTLQKHFNPSKTFQPWLQNELSRRKNDTNWQTRRKKRKIRPEVKIGHGGTLDPMATGVLIAGIGQGTKHLIKFLECRKTYETVILFGAETDTYDRVGKIVRKGPYEHITREVVEEAMKQFRGKIMQRPPIFSAKSIQGKRLYEYAREGIEPPVEIKSRQVEVYDLQILEWYEPGTHNYRWPEEKLAGEEKKIAEKILEKEAAIPVASEAEEVHEAANASSNDSPLKKRKISPSPAETSEVLDDGQKTTSASASSKRLKTDIEGSEPVEAATEDATIKKPEDPTPINTTEGESPTEAPAKEEEEKKEETNTYPPAIKITMTVSSGFYVRSLAHDLGKAVGSCGLMSALVRSKQADYTLDPENILEYKDLEAGEEVWAPKVIRFLEEWQERNPSDST